MSLRIRRVEGDGAVRIQYGDGEHLSKMSIVYENPGKVFAVIGPFDGHADKVELQRSLEMLLRGANVTSG